MRYKIDGKFLFASLIISFMGTHISAQVSPSIAKNGVAPFWAQGKNEDKGCSPSYNYYCKSNEDTSCDKAPAGCGPVAMGMIMYKFEWPYTKYHYYNWDVMGAKLREGDPDYIPRLLRDCGTAAETNYGDLIDASWTLPSELTEGMNNMKYNCKRYEEKDWKGYGTAWTDLIKSELDAGRPIIVHGEDNNIFNSHFFVLDGYGASGYSINTGWGDGNTTISSLDDFLYKNDRSIYAGIYPKFPNMPDNYTSISLSGEALTEIDAKNSIKNSNSSVTVSSGKTLVLVAGDKIELGPGISIKPGGNLKLKIRPDFKQENKTITCSFVDKYINRTCKVTGNNSVRVNVSNADSWEAEIYDRTGKLIWRTAGPVKGSQIKIWDGSSVGNVVYNGETYWIVLILKNNSSRLEKTTYIAVNDAYCGGVDYEVISGEKALTPDCVDGENDELSYRTSAEYWTFNLYDRWGKSLLKRNGSVKNGKATLLSNEDAIHLKLPNNKETTFWYDVDFYTYSGYHSKVTSNFALLNSSGCPRSVKSLRVGVDPVLEFTDNFNEFDIANESNDVEIYPNPSNGVFSVIVGDNYCLNPYDIYVEDIKTGRVVYSATGLKMKNHTISLNNIASGVYIVRIDNGLYSNTKKLIIK